MGFLCRKMCANIGEGNGFECRGKVSVDSTNK